MRYKRRGINEDTKLLELPFTKIGKTLEGEDWQEFVFRHMKSEMPIRHPKADSKQAVKITELEVYTGTVQFGGYQCGNGIRKMSLDLLPSL